MIKFLVIADLSFLIIFRFRELSRARKSSKQSYPLFCQWYWMPVRVSKSEPENFSTKFLSTKRACQLDPPELIQIDSIFSYLNLIISIFSPLRGAGTRTFFEATFSLLVCLFDLGLFIHGNQFPAQFRGRGTHRPLERFLQVFFSSTQIRTRVPLHPWIHARVQSPFGGFHVADSAFPPKHSPQNRNTQFIWISYSFG